MLYGKRLNAEATNHNRACKMETKQIEKRFRLAGPVRDHIDRVHFREQPTILQEVNNLDRQMFLVQFDDGATTFLLAHEVAP